MSEPSSAIVRRLQQYAQDVESFVSNPSAFLVAKRQDGSTIVLDALIFLTVSATLSAVLEVLPDSAKPQNPWPYAWESFRSHVFPALLFTYLQAFAVSICARTPWRTFFAVYAYSLGALLVLRSIAVTIVWSFTGGPAFLQDSIISAVFLSLLVVMVVWRQARRLALCVVVVAFTILNGYVVGMFEIAVKDRGLRIGFFEPVVLVARGQQGSQEGMQLMSGVNDGRLERGDREVDQKYEDAWTIDGEPNDRITIEVSSRQFDTYVRLLDPAGRLVGVNDDNPDAVGYTTDSRIETVLRDEGEHKVVVTSYEPLGYGDYTVSHSRVRAATAQQESLFWQSIMNSSDSADFAIYLEQFPAGLFRALAENRCAALGGTCGVEESSAMREPPPTGP